MQTQTEASQPPTSNGPQVTNESQLKREAQKKREWRSKLIDGILSASILILLWLLIELAVRPIEYVFGPPGLLVYVLGLLAVSMFALQQALVNRHGETLRTWYGICGGFLAWSVIEVINELGVPVMPNMASLVLLIMVGLIVMLLWRNLPLGARYFSLTFLLNWVGMVFMRVQGILARYSPIFDLAYRATGWLSLMGVLAVLIWILFRSRRRPQRVMAALVVWFLTSLAIYVLRGSLF